MDIFRKHVLCALLAAALFVPTAAAIDITIVTDPFLAAIMPKPDPLSPVFIPAYIRPPGRVYSFEMPFELPDMEKYPATGLASRTPQLPDKVFATVPPSNSLFPRNSIVTLGWVPANREINDQDAPSKVQIPIRYEVFVSRHDRWSARIFIKEIPTTRHYTYLFKPPGPGRYQWHIRAIYDRAMAGINSDVRNFVVLP